MAKPAAIATGWHEYVYPWNSSIVGDSSSGVASISVSYIFPLHSTAPRGHHGVRESLCARYQIERHVEILRRRAFPEPAESGNDLVEYQEYVVNFYFLSGLFCLRHKCIPHPREKV